VVVFCVFFVCVLLVHQCLARDKKLLTELKMHEVKNGVYARNELKETKMNRMYIVARSDS